VSYVSSFHIPVEKRVPVEARGKMMSVPNDVEIKKGDAAIGLRQGARDGWGNSVFLTNALGCCRPPSM
jgi:hypothetical protein